MQGQLPCGWKTVKWFLHRSFPPFWGNTGIAATEDSLTSTYMSQWVHSSTPQL